MIGSLTISRNLYMHYAIEHTFGHHRNVATPIDPSSARKGETIWAFFYRSIVGSYLSAWDLECQRV